MNSLLRKIKDQIPLITLFVLIIVASLIIRERANTVYLVAVAMASFCVACYALLGRRINSDKELSFRSAGWYDLSIFLMLLAILSWWIRPDQYVMPTSYFILIALSSGGLFVCAAFGGTPRYIVLAACAMILLHVFTANLLFPGLLGADPGTHMFKTTYLLNLAGTGPNNPPLTISNLGGSYSLMHVYLREVMDLMHLDYKLSSLIFWSAPQAIGNVVLAFLIGRRLFSPKVGAVSAILMANSGWVIFFSQWAIPNGIGATLALLVAFIGIWSYQKQRYWPLLSLPAILFAAMLTDPIDVLWVALAILVIGVPLALQKRYLTAVVPTLLVLLFLWMQFSSVGNALEESLSPGHSLSPNGGATLSGSDDINKSSTSWEPYVPSNSPSVPQVTLVNAMRNPAELTVNSLGMFLSISISLIGILIMLSTSGMRRVWALFSAAALIVGFIPGLLGVFLVETRWWYLAESLVVIPLALVLLRISRNKLSLAVSSLIVTIIVFLSIIGTPANTTDRLLAPDLTVRYGLTSKEIQGLDVLKSLDGTKYNIQTVGADPLYALFLNSTPEFNGRVRWVFSQIVYGDFTNLDVDILMLRDSLHKEPFGFGSGVIYQVKFDPVALAVKQGYTDIWSNGEIHLLVLNRLLESRTSG